MYWSDQNFCPYYGGLFYGVLNSEGLLKEVPLYRHRGAKSYLHI